MAELKLRLQIGNAVLEAEGDSIEVQKERVEFLNFLEGYVETSASILNQQNTILTPEIRTPLVGGERQYASFAELKKEKKFKSATDLVMGVAWFLYRCLGKETFTTNDIKDILQRSHIGIPSNVTQNVNDNIKKGLIEEYKTAKENNNEKLLRVLDGADEWMENYGEK